MDKYHKTDKNKYLSTKESTSLTHRFNKDAKKINLFLHFIELLANLIFFLIG